MIYVLGTDHHLQFGCCDQYSLQEYEKFKGFLSKLIDKKEICLVAEEASQEAKIDFCEGNVAQTNLENVASTKNIKHLFLDPDREQSRKLKIKRRGQLISGYGWGGAELTHQQYHRINAEAAPHDCKREKEWLQRLCKESQPHQKILVVCGYMHIESFLILLRENRYEAVDIKPSIFK